MRQLSVVHIVEDLKTGGLERVLATIVEGLDRERYAVSVWCISRGGAVADELQAKGIDVYIAGMRHSRDLRTFAALCRHLRDRHVDILHAHGYTATTLGRLSGLIAGVPILFVHQHSNYVNYNRKQLLVERIFGSFTDKVVCCSNAVAEFVVRSEKIAPHKVVTVYNGINALPVEAGGVPAGTDIASGTTVVGCVASLTPHKGHRYLLEAAKIVLDRVPGTRFLLVGDGPLRGELEQYAAQLGISSNVRFTGQQLSVGPLLSGMDVVVLPSDEREGLGIALIEAMAMGKPVIGTSIGGIPEVVQDRMNGLIVPPKDVAALASAICLIITDRPLARRMGENGRAAFETKFTSQQMIAQIDRLYQEAANRKIRT